MMTGLSIVLGATLVLFIGSLIFAVVEDWFTNRFSLQKMVADQLSQAGIAIPMQRNFHRAARRPARVLGTFIF